MNVKPADRAGPDCPICGARPVNARAGVCPHGIEGGCLFVGGRMDMSGWRGDAGGRRPDNPGPV